MPLAIEAEQAHEVVALDAEAELVTPVLEQIALREKARKLDLHLYQTHDQLGNACAPFTCRVPAKVKHVEDRCPVQSGPASCRWRWR